MALLDLALEYALLGWPVFPLEPRGKQPLGRLVAHGLLDASTEPEQITRWWRKEPEANIGGATGHVADAMDLDSGEAMNNVVRLFQEHDLDPTMLPRAETGGGGRHVFFKPTGLGNRAGVLEGVDWRGKGGYVVLPGSLHPNGKPYRWIVQGEPLPAPEFLVELLRKPASPPSAAQVLAEAPQNYIKAAIEDELEKLRSAPQGQRNDTLNRAAYALGKMVGAGWLSQFRAEAHLKLAAYACGLEEPEVSRTIRSGMEDGIAHPREAVPDRSGGEIRRSGHADTQASPSPEVGRPAASAKSEVGKIKLTGWEDLIDMPDSDPDWLVDGLLIMGGFSLIAAKPKVGKSVLARNLAMAVAQGTDFLGRATKQGGVVYLAHEEQFTEVRRHFKSLGLEREAKLWIHVGGVGPQALADLTTITGELRPTLVIIDPLFRFTKAKDVSDYAEITTALEPLLLLARDEGFHLCCVHHAGKMERETGDNVLGSTAIFGTVDTLIALRIQPGSGRRIVQSVQRYGHNLEESVLVMEETTGMVGLTGRLAAISADVLDRQVLQMLRAEGDLSINYMLERISVRKDRLLDSVERLVGLHKVMRRGEGTRGSPWLYSTVRVVREQQEPLEPQEQQEPLELQEPQEPEPNKSAIRFPDSVPPIGRELKPNPLGAAVAVPSSPEAATREQGQLPVVPRPTEVLEPNDSSSGTESREPDPGRCRIEQRGGQGFCLTHLRSLDAEGRCPAVGRRPAPW